MTIINMTVPAPTTPMQLKIKKIGLLITLLLFSLLSFAEPTEPETNQTYRQVQIEAEQGDAYAQLLLGLMHIKGFGVVKSSSEAAKWFRKSAENGNANAQYNLGVYGGERGIRTLGTLP